MTPPFAQQVSWWSVHLYVEPLLAAVGRWPMAGSVEWCALPDDDVRKLAAVLDGGRHHALRVETAQVALSEASRDISGAADWTSVSREMLQRNAVYIPRRAS